ncbi:MAG: biopolymer transporter ExbD [Planctomycetota bacterium]
MAVQLRKNGAISSLTMTPLIDVVFLLLIFFLVASRFSEEERYLDLNLPSVSEAMSATAEVNEIVINIDADGKYFIDGAFRPLEQVESILGRAKSNNPLSQSVVIRADKTVEFDAVAAAMNLCKKVGIDDFTVITDDPA